MAQIQWIKLSTDIFSNRKIKQIERCENGAEIALIWIKLLCLAGIVNDRGMVYIAEDSPYTPELLAVEFSCSEEIIRKALAVFERFGMADTNNPEGHLQICDWEKHQNIEALDKLREKHREAQAKYRQKQKNTKVTSPVISPVISGDAAEKEKENNKENEKDKDNRSAESAFSKTGGGCEKENAPFSDCRLMPEQSVLKTPAPYSAGFERFWDSYPVKAHKRKCFEIWQKEKLDTVAEQITAAVAEQKKTVQWKKDDGRFIPNPQTYLTKGLWEDISPAITAAPALQQKRNKVLEFLEFDTNRDAFNAELTQSHAAASQSAFYP